MNQARYVCLSFSLMLFVLGLSAQEGYLISGNFRNQPLVDILDQWQESYGLLFNYDDTYLRQIRVSVHIRNQPVQSALDQLLSGTGISYQILEQGQIALSPPLRIRQAPDQKTRSSAVEMPKINGRVMEDSEESSLPYATVSIKGKHIRTLSNEDGYFVLNYAYRPEDTLVISYVGYKTREIPLSKEILANPLRVHLQIVPHSLDDVIIEEGTNQSIAIADGPSEISINPEKVALLSGLGEPDILRSLQLLPGVGSTGESASDLAVRGGTPDQTLVLLDGITVYQSGHFFGLLGAFNTYAIKDVTLYRGGLSARYGGRVSGVIDMTGKPLSVAVPKIGASLNLMNSSGFLEMPVFNGKGALLIAGRRSFTDIIKSGLYKGLFSNIFQQGIIQNNMIRSEEDPYGLYSLTPAFHFYDMNVKLSFQPTRKDLLSISLYKGVDELDYTFQTADSSLTYQTLDHLSLNNRGLSINWSRQWKERFYSKLNASVSHFQSDYAFRDESHDEHQYFFSSGITQGNQLEDYSLRLDNQWAPLPKHSLHFGSHLSKYLTGNRISSEIIGVEPSVVGWTLTANVLSGYAEHQYKPSEKWSMSTGLRLSYLDNIPDNYYWEPRFSLFYRPGPNWAFKAAMGQYYQFINQIEIFNPLRVGEDFWALADGEKIPVVNSRDLVIGGAYETPDFVLDVETYYKQLKNILTYSWKFNPISADYHEWLNDSLFANGRGMVKGIDVLLQKKAGKYTGWLSYSLSQVKHQFEDINEGSAYFANHDHRHQLKWVNMLSIPKWDFSAVFLFATGRPYTEAVGFYAERVSPHIEVYRVAFGSRNDQRLPDYHRIDLSASYHGTIGKARVKIGGSILNVLNRKNFIDKQYWIKVPITKRESSELRVLNKQALGFSPNVFLHIEF